MNRLFLLASVLVVAFIVSLSANENPPAPYGATPTEQQVQWQRLEFYAFVHLGLNTWTNKEWGYGDENPALFNPTKFDANKIIKTFKDGGMKGMIYTAKHHDGWCSWQTATTEHSIKKSPYQNGKGDIVREFSEACKAENLLFGTYLSPWDRNCAEYGGEGYIKIYYQQIEELLTNYGEVFEIWFDGANGGDGFYGGAREKRNIGEAATYYNFPQLVKNIRALQPNCIIWGAGANGDARWGGSEKGHVGYPHWNTLGAPENAEPLDGCPAPCAAKCRWIPAAHGIKNGPRWVAAEGDTPINHAGWFWHPNQNKKVKKPAELLNVWFDCVGRGANLILNLAPNREGELDAADVETLMGFKKLRDELYKNDFALGATIKNVSNMRGEKFGAQNLVDDNLETYWATDDNVASAEVILKLKTPATFDVIRVREEIRLGQRVDEFAVDALINNDFKEIANGLTIGNQVMLRVEKPITTDTVRLRIISAGASPTISEFSLLKMPTIETVKTEKSSTNKLANAKWKIISAPENTNAEFAFDNDPQTLWSTKNAQTPLPQTLTVDLGETRKINGFTYLPRQDGEVNGMTNRYIFALSADGENWQTMSEGEFGNLQANPIEQTISFSPTNARFFRFTATAVIYGKFATIAELGIIVE